MRAGMGKLALNFSAPRGSNSVLGKTIALEFSMPPKRVVATIKASLSYG